MHLRVFCKVSMYVHVQGHIKHYFLRGGEASQRGDLLVLPPPPPPPPPPKKMNHCCISISTSILCSSGISFVPSLWPNSTHIHVHVQRCKIIFFHCSQWWMGLKAQLESKSFSLSELGTYSVCIDYMYMKFCGMSLIISK